ncbi:MAG: hypothetical protein LBV16_09265 [Elusimicrobiota bacterium]|jgi:hypothetical protein|nr:hypothetical protein [Elusimicrobiota bacterium]
MKNIKTKIAILGCILIFLVLTIGSCTCTVEPKDIIKIRTYRIHTDSDTVSVGQNIRVYLYEYDDGAYVRTVGISDITEYTSEPSGIGHFLSPIIGVGTYINFRGDASGVAIITLVYKNGEAVVSKKITVIS